jgi:uncharacterized membrane protein
MHYLTVMAFADENQAFQLRDALRECRDQSLLEMTEAVVVTRDAEGKVHMHKSSSDVALGLASAGSAVGLIVGAIFLQPWIGSLVGLSAGAIAGARLSLGIDEKFLKEVGATVTPGTSAIFMLGHIPQFEKIEAKLGPLLKGGKILQTSVSPEREEEALRMLGRVEKQSQ